MPTTSDGRQFPYTADGIRAAEAHERSLKQERRRMGKQSDKTTGDPFSTIRPSKQKRNPMIIAHLYLTSPIRDIVVAVLLPKFRPVRNLLKMFVLFKQMIPH